jgi:hypothetical protein
VGGIDRTELSQRSVASLINSMLHAQQKNPALRCHLHMIIDQATPELQSYCHDVVQRTRENFSMSLCNLDGEHGIAASIRQCYLWMQQAGGDLVAQFQDDYIFYPHAISDSVMMFEQLRRDCSTDAVISLYNNPNHWNFVYRYQSTPRMLTAGASGYWIQNYDLSCSFLTSHRQFNRHWDLYTDFFYLIDKRREYPDINILENRTLNLMLVDRDVLGMQPVRSLMLHMQTDRDLDPFCDWKKLWNSIAL